MARGWADKIWSFDTYPMCFGNSLPGIKLFSKQSCEVGYLPTLSPGPAIEESVEATSGPCSGAAFAEPCSPVSAGLFVRPLPRQFVSAWRPVKAKSVETLSRNRP